MAKKTYELKQDAVSSDQSTALATAAQIKMASVEGKVVASNPDNAGLFLEQFQDLSLPPIIKAKNLEKGSVIFGEIDGFSVFDDGKKIRSVLIVVHVLRGNESTRKLERIGMRAALPLGAVLARSLGTRQGTQQNPIKPEEQIAEIEKVGWTVGSVLAMQYQGEGQKRDKGMNNPHLWNIKAMKPDEAKTVLAPVSTPVKAGKK